MYELVLLGANGYTGRVTAEYITTNLPTDLNWALAGRSKDKLSALAHELHQLDANRRQPGRASVATCGAINDRVQELKLPGSRRQTSMR